MYITQPNWLLTCPSSLIRMTLCRKHARLVITHHTYISCLDQIWLQLYVRSWALARDQINHWACITWSIRNLTSEWQHDLASVMVYVKKAITSVNFEISGCTSWFLIFEKTTKLQEITFRVFFKDDEFQTWCPLRTCTYVHKCRNSFPVFL